MFIKKKEKDISLLNKTGSALIWHWTRTKRTTAKIMIGIQSVVKTFMLITVIK